MLLKFLSLGIISTSETAENDKVVAVKSLVHFKEIGIYSLRRSITVKIWS